RPVDYPIWPTIIKTFFILLLATLATLALWLLASAFVSGVRNESFQRALLQDGLLHAPVIATLLLLLLPGYDPRFPRNWPFQGWILFLAIVLLLGMGLFHFV